MTGFADAATLEGAAQGVNLVQGEHITADATGAEFRTYIRTVLHVDEDWVLEYLADRWSRGYGESYKDKPAFLAYMVGYVEGLALGRRLPSD
jgi:hypothetical protein